MENVMIAGDEKRRRGMVVTKILIRGNEAEIGAFEDVFVARRIFANGAVA